MDRSGLDRIGPRKKSPGKLTIPVEMEGQKTLALVDLGCNQIFVRKWIAEVVGKLEKRKSLLNVSMEILYGILT